MGDAASDHRAVPAATPAVPTAPPAGLPCAETDVTAQGVWDRALVLAESNPALHSCMELLKIVELVGVGGAPRVIVGHAPRDRFAAEAALVPLGKVLGQALGTPVSVSLRAVADAGGLPTRSGVQHGASARAGELSEPGGRARLASRDGGLGGDDSGVVATGAEGAGRASAVVLDAKAAMDNPLVEDAIALLGATVKSVRARKV